MRDKRKSKLIRDIDYAKRKIEVDELRLATEKRKLKKLEDELMKIIEP